MPSLFDHHKCGLPPSARDDLKIASTIRLNEIDNRAAHLDGAKRARRRFCPMLDLGADVR